MQTAYVSTKRDAGPILNVLLAFVILTVIFGAVCLGIGVKIGDSFSSVSSVGSSFWWGGLTLILLGVFYIPCHILVKLENNAGRPLFIVWTFLIGIGVVVILASTAITGIVWALVQVYNADSCAYTANGRTYTPASSPCIAQCNAGLSSKFFTVPERTCCCCNTDKTLLDYEIIYAKGVSSCSLFTDSLSLSKVLTILYIISLILIFIDMVMGYVVACSCCAVQSPWIVTQPATVTTVTAAPIQGGYVAEPVATQPYTAYPEKA